MNIIIEQLKMILNENSFRYTHHNDSVSFYFEESNWFMQKYQRELLPFLKNNTRQLKFAAALSTENRCITNITVSPRQLI